MARRRGRRAMAALSGCVLCLAAACGDSFSHGIADYPTTTAAAPAVGVSTTTATTPGPGTTAAATAPVAAVRLKAKVVSKRPHDPNSFTQGLVFVGNRLYESAGLYGTSSLREVDPKTGKVLRTTPVAGQYFAEGLAAVDGRLVQLTWREKTALVYRADTFEPLERFTYDTEGWGLCDDGTRLVMSDGTSTLYFRDRTTFAVLSKVDVTLDGRPRDQLNELECVDGVVFANVWQTDTIVRIDPASGRITALIDASGLLSATEARNADVLNGIAYDAQARTFLITGKHWPTMFEVQWTTA